MKRPLTILSLIIIMIFVLCSCTKSNHSLGKEKNIAEEQKFQPVTQVDCFEISITQIDFSVYQADGSLRLQLYGDLAQVLATSEAANRINTTLMHSYETWLPKMEEFRDNDWSEAEIKEGTQSRIGPLHNTWNVETTYQDDYCLSFREVWDSYYGQMLSHTEFYGKTFDKRTGELITLQQLFGNSYESILRSFGYNYVPSCLKNNFWKTEELNFYIASDGEIVLQLPPVWNMIRWGDEIPMGVYITLENDEVVAAGRENLLGADYREIRERDYIQMEDAIRYYVEQVETRRWGILEHYRCKYFAESDTFTVYRIIQNPHFSEIKRGICAQADDYLTEDLLKKSIKDLRDYVAIEKGQTYYGVPKKDVPKINLYSFQYTKDGGQIKMAFNIDKKQKEPDVVAMFTWVNGELRLASVECFGNN